MLRKCRIDHPSWHNVPLIVYDPTVLRTMTAEGTYFQIFDIMYDRQRWRPAKLVLDERAITMSEWLVYARVFVGQPGMPQ